VACALGVAALPLGSGALLLLQAAPALRAQDAPSDRFHASLVLGAGRVPARPAVRLIRPGSGAQLVDPPLLRWDGSARTDPDASWTIDFCLAPGRPVCCLYDEFGFMLPGDELQLPAEVWESFPPGQPILWRVRQLPDRSRGQSELDMPSSGFFRITRLSGG
jgi:hypothetical protein